MSNDLVPSAGQNATAPSLSPGLKKLLTEGEDAAGACRIISLNPKLREESERQLPMLKAAKAPAERNDILAILVRRAPQYGITEKLAGEWATFFEDYLEALDGLPAYAIEEAFLRWNRGEGHTNLQMASFYPKSAQLYMLAQKAKTELWMAAYRAEKALAHAEQAAKPKPSAEERAQVAAQMRDLAANIGGKALPTRSPTQSPQQVAAELRASALEARSMGMPVSKADVEDPGDVI